LRRRLISAVQGRSEPHDAIAPFAHRDANRIEKALSID
jgi:hypothetical protein